MKKFVYYLLAVSIIIGVYSYKTIQKEREHSYETPQEAILHLDSTMTLIPGYLTEKEALFFFIQGEKYIGATFVNKRLFGWALGTERPLIPMGKESNVHRVHVMDHLFVFGFLPKGIDHSVRVNGIDATVLPLMMAEEVRENREDLQNAVIWYVLSDEELTEPIDIQLYDDNTMERVPAKFIY